MKKRIEQALNTFFLVIVPALAAAASWAYFGAPIVMQSLINYSDEAIARTPYKDSAALFALALLLFAWFILYGVCTLGVFSVTRKVMQGLRKSVEKDRAEMGYK